MTDTKITFLGKSVELINHVMNARQITSDPLQMVQDAADRAGLMAHEGIQAINTVTDSDNLTIRISVGTDFIPKPSGSISVWTTTRSATSGR